MPSVIQSLAIPDCGILQREQLGCSNLSYALSQSLLLGE